MTDSMRERLARAIWDAICAEAAYAEIGAAPPGKGGLHNVCIDGNINLYSAADAALDALLEPTEGMVLASTTVTASWQNIPGSGLTVAREKARRRFQAMIRAAKEGQ